MLLDHAGIIQPCTALIQLHSNMDLFGFCRRYDNPSGLGSPEDDKPIEAVKLEEATPNHPTEIAKLSHANLSVCVLSVSMHVYIVCIHVHDLSV